MRSPAARVSDSGMANGSPEGFVLRSGVRSGLKREFSWALKAQSQIPSSLSRTRSGKSPATFSSPLPVNNKKPKRSDGRDSPSAVEPIKIDNLDASEKDVGPPPPPPPPPPSSPPTLPEKPFRRFTRSVMKGFAIPPGPIDQAGEGVEVPILIEEDDGRSLGEAQDVMVKSSTGLVLKPQREEPAMHDNLIDLDGQDGSENPGRVLPSPVLEIKVEKIEPSMETTPLNGIVSEEPVKRFSRSSKLKEPVVPMEDSCKPERRFTRLALKTMVKVEIEDQDVMVVDAASPEYPTKRITRSAMKVAVETPIESGDRDIKKDDASVEVSAINGSLRTTPKKKLELKMSKKIALTKTPSNIKELLVTGLLEGFPVMYVTGNGMVCVIIT